MVNLKDYAPFTGLLIFGNIENLILASQTKIAIKYADYIEIIGGVAIIILGLESILEAMGFI